MAKADWQGMAVAEVPKYNEMLWPVLQAVAELGGSGSIGEIVETVIKRESFTDDQQAVLHNDGPETEIGYRLAWARTYLKAMGLLTNSARGVWALSDDGTTLLADPPCPRASAANACEKYGQRTWRNCARPARPGRPPMTYRMRRYPLRNATGRNSYSIS